MDFIIAAVVGLALLGVWALYRARKDRQHYYDDYLKRKRGKH